MATEGIAILYGDLLHAEFRLRTNFNTTLIDHRTVDSRHETNSCITVKASHTSLHGNEAKSRQKNIIISHPKKKKAKVVIIIHTFPPVLLFSSSPAGCTYSPPTYPHLRVYTTTSQLSPFIYSPSSTHVLPRSLETYLILCLVVNPSSSVVTTVRVL